MIDIQNIPEKSFYVKLGRDIIFRSDFLHEAVRECNKIPKSAVYDFTNTIVVRSKAKVDK